MGLRTHIHRNPLIRWEFNKIRYENWANQSRSVWIDSHGWVELRYDWWNHGRCVLLHKLVLWIRIVIFPQVEANVLRSSTGDVSDYKLLPWAIPKQSLYEHLNTYYKDVSMKNFKHCSNIPQFEGKFQPPLPKQTYFGNKCVIDGNGLPEIVPAGFYLIVIKCYGPGQPTWNTTSVFKITPRLM